MTSIVFTSFNCFVTYLIFIFPVSYWMYQAEKYHGVSMKRYNEEYLGQIDKATSCPLMLSQHSEEGNDYTAIVSCWSCIHVMIFFVPCFINYLLSFSTLHYFQYPQTIKNFSFPLLLYAACAILAIILQLGKTFK